MCRKLIYLVSFVLVLLEEWKLIELSCRVSKYYEKSSSLVDSSFVDRIHRVQSKLCTRSRESAG
ncbi:hypothetical protein ES703_78965 [subsurface metagenome]